jgi:hypothetical protein
MTPPSHRLRSFTSDVFLWAGRALITIVLALMPALLSISLSTASAGAAPHEMVPGLAAAEAKPKAHHPASATRTKALPVTFGVEPASAHAIDSRPYFSFGATPGAFVTDHVALVNYSTQPLLLQLYATDAVETANGGFGLLRVGQRPAGVGTWVSFPSRFASDTVPPRTAHAPGQVIVPITLRVPDRTTPGDHVGGIVAALRTVGINKSGQRVILVLRVATRVFVRVAGALHPAVAITDLHATYNGTANPFGQGSVAVSYTVQNTGNVDLALAGQTVAISGLFGGERNVKLPAIGLLLTGSSLHESEAIGGVWPQLFANATVTARPFAPAGFSAPPLAPVSASTWTWAIPWSLLGLILVVIALAVALLVFRLRARRARRAAALPGKAKPRLVNA